MEPEGEGTYSYVVVLGETRPETVRSDSDGVPSDSLVARRPQERGCCMAPARRFEQFQIWLVLSSVSCVTSMCIVQVCGSLPQFDQGWRLGSSLAIPPRSKDIGLFARHPGHTKGFKDAVLIGFSFAKDTTVFGPDGMGHGARLSVTYACETSGICKDAT